MFRLPHLLSPRLLLAGLALAATSCAPRVTLPQTQISSGVSVNGRLLTVTLVNLGPHNLLLKNERSASVVPPVPLDWCGAQTQATIGALMLSALDGALARRGSDRRSAALVSRTLVDAADPGFTEPSKPIGRYLPEDEARVLIGHGQHFVEVPDRGWRRVVASPEPLACLDGPAADTLLAGGARLVRDVAAAREAASARGQRLLTFAVEAEVGFARPADLERFADALAERIEELAAEFGPGERKYRVLIGGHPA